METISVHIGSSRILSSGQAVDTLRPVEFEAELVGSYRTLTGDNDTRGIDQALYRTPDDRLIVHVKDWSRWQGEPDTYSLHEVNEADLGVNGEYEDLGRECGFGRALTLDEALAE
jgi:hypothetical protein